MTHPLSRNCRPHAWARARACALALALAGGALCAAAQTSKPAPLRDPMVPPLSIARPAAANLETGGPSEPPPPPQQLLTVDGRRYVVDGRRRLGVGDALGNTRIERITDSAVWVREGNTVTRLPFYAGVVKQSVPLLPAATAPAPQSTPARSRAPHSSPSSTQGELP